jgi:hypothetical protein
MISSLVTDGCSSMDLRLERPLNLTLDLEASFPHEGEYKIRPSESLEIARMDSVFSGNPNLIFSRTPSYTRIRIRVLDGVPERYHCG